MNMFFFFEIKNILRRSF